MYGRMLNITCDVKLYIEQARNNLVTFCADTKLSGASNMSKARLRAQGESAYGSDRVRVQLCVLLMGTCMGKCGPIPVCVCVHTLYVHTRPQVH